MSIKRVCVIITALAVALTSCRASEQHALPAIPRPTIPVVEENEPQITEPSEESQETKPSAFYNSYNVSMEINPAARKVVATEKIAYKNQTGQELDKIYIRFNINAFSESYVPRPYLEELESKVFKYGENYSDFSLTSISINSENVGYEIDGRNIGVMLTKPLPHDSNIDITLQFECTIPKICHRIGANGDAMWFGNFIPVVATFYDGEFVLDKYYPVGSPFVYEMSNFDVTVTTPKDYFVYGTGNETVTESDTNNVTRFTINFVRDFAFAVSNKYKKDTVTASDVAINFLHYTDDPRRVSMVLDAAAMAVDYVAERAGTYPYQSIDIVETELFFESSMAFPCVVFIDSDYFRSRSNFDSVVREISRQWFFNVVGNNQIKEAWLDEGLTAYLQSRMNYRSEVVDMRMKDLHADMSQKFREAERYSMLDDLSVYTSWSEYYDVQLYRAQLMFHALFRKLGGLDKWNEFVKTYYSECSFKIASKQNIVDIASNVYGERLDDFFESWLTWRELPNMP